MHLTRCKDQNSRSLEEFYEVSHDAYDVEGGLRRRSVAALSLLARLRGLDDPRRVYGLTSLGTLCLLAEDTWQSPWLVRINLLDEHNYSIEYLMPERLAPWPQAYVHGEARSEDGAVRMILTAMDRSEGWPSAK